MLIADSSTSISKVSVGNTNTVLFSNGLGRTPSWRSIQGSDLTGIVSVSNGGTGKNTLSGVLFGNGTNAVSSASGQQIVDVIDETPVKNASYAAIAASLEDYSQYNGVSFNNMKGFSSTLSDIKSNGVASLGTSQYVASVDHIHPSDNTRAPKDSPYFTSYIRVPQGTLSGQSIRFGNLDKTGLYSTSDTSLNVAVNNSDNIQLSSTSTTILKNVSLPSTTTIGSVSGTEISYISGARSNIQNQIDAFMYQVPAGAVIFTASQSLPTGYLLANGAEVSRTQFAALFSSIGTTYGSGNGSTTFKLPDLRGEFIRGADLGRGVDTGRTIGSWQAQQIAKHKHVSPWGEIYDAPFGRSTNNGYMGSSSTDGDNYRYFTNDGSDWNYDGQVNPSGLMGSEVRPRNIALMACIKY